MRPNWSDKQLRTKLGTRFMVISLDGCLPTVLAVAHALVTVLKK